MNDHVSLHAVFYEQKKSSTTCKSVFTRGKTVTCHFMLSFWCVYLEHMVFRCEIYVTFNVNDLRFTYKGDASFCYHAKCKRISISKWSASVKWDICLYTWVSNLCTGPNWSPVRVSMCEVREACLHSFSFFIFVRLHVWRSSDLTKMIMKCWCEHPE